MNYKLFTTSASAWDSMLRAIDQSKKSIFIEMYIFLDDTQQSHDFIGKILKKASEGVHVVIVVDSYGSKNLDSKIIQAIRQSSVELLFFSHWLRHIHRKVLIVDERIAFIGGVNIGKKFAQWNDLQLRLHGRFVKRVIKSFAYTYAVAGGKNAYLLACRKRKVRGKFKLWLIDQWSVKNIHTMKNHYINKISRAEKIVKIVTPYFTPPRWMISLLESATRRGVIVEIIIPEKADIFLADRLNYRYMYKLHTSKLHFYLSKNMNHSKLLIIDNQECLVGSQNIDPISFGFNAEIGVFLKEKRVLRKLIDVFEIWKESAIRFEPKHFKTNALDYIILFFIKLFHPML